MAFTAFTLIPFIWLQRLLLGGVNGGARLSLSVLRLLCVSVCVCFKHD